MSMKKINAHISKKQRVYSYVLLMVFSVSLFQPVTTYALTGGPSQPEFSKFSPASYDDMVNLFSGDFNYNIPIMDVEGYPINLSYNSNLPVEEEASWVGTGWTLNPGALNRSVRGLPDDFSGDELHTVTGLRPNNTFGTSIAVKGEVIGIDFMKVGLNMGVFYNNYKGMGYEFGASLSMSSSAGKFAGNAGLNGSFNSQSGLNLNPTLGITSAVEGESDQLVPPGKGISLTPNFNTRSGLTSISIEPISMEKTTGSSIHKTRKNSDGSPDKTVQMKISSGTSATVPIGTQSYTPKFGMSMQSYSVYVTVGLGAEVFWVDAKGYVSGYFTSQFLRDKVVDSPAYGYAYSEHSAERQDAVLDFNREKDGAFSESTPGLPLTNFTYDVFSASGQGISGSYRPHRSDVGVVYDKRIDIKSDGGSIGFDGAGGQLFKLGANFGYSFTNSWSGQWKHGNDLASKYGFATKKRNQDFEPVYFQQAGELTEIDETFYKNIGGNNPIKPAINGGGSSFGSMVISRAGSFLNQLVNGNVSNKGTLQNKKIPRRQPLRMLTAMDASNYSMDKTIKIYQNYKDSIGNLKFYEMNNARCVSAAYPRANFRKQHHYSEAQVLRNDGTQFIYGLPAYNLTKKEVSFNSHPRQSGSEKVEDNGDLTYSLNDVDRDKNKNGITEYFSATTTPAYVHSMLLTHVVSADYLDQTMDGPTDDDLGAYTTFNYKQTHNVGNPYKWRSPSGLKERQATRNEGFFSDLNDNKGFYTYGEKEVYYLSHMKTKNHIAIFYTSDRKDGYGVSGEHGKIDFNTTPLQKLDSIKLYAKTDWALRDSNHLPTPIKTAHLEYDYSLAPGVYNNCEKGYCDSDNHPEVGSGKLTLRKVYFTYRNSKRGMLNPYEFHYDLSDTNHPFHIPGVSGIEASNPDYGENDIDRWGFYQKETNTVNYADKIQSRQLSQKEFPYGVQSKGLADKNARSWIMNAIKLPTGGVVKVDFESDTYKYVQDKKAMRMLKIKGFAKNPGDEMSNDLFNNNTFFNNTGNNVVFFELADQSHTGSDVQNKYLAGVDELYYRCLVDLNGKGNYEFVTGFSKIESSGVTSGSTKLGWAKLKYVRVQDRKSQDKDMNPIAKTTWQMARLHLSHLIFPGSNPNGESGNALINNLRGLVGFLRDLKMLITGYNKSLRDWGYGQTVNVEKSWIRAFVPDGEKFGGGARVKQIKMYDHWNSMAGADYQENVYGYNYDYNTLDNNGTIISSGVASWEPVIGREENPHILPESYSDVVWCAPDNRYIQEKPYGESFFPNPSIGYAKITKSDFKNGYSGMKGTGKTITEFYTAREFPTKTNQTPMDKVKLNPGGIVARLLKIYVYTSMTASQGYVVELNDMHGKQKATAIYSEGVDIPMSKIAYHYKTGNGANTTTTLGSLDNRVKVVNKDGRVREALVGVEADLVLDAREQNSHSMNFKIGANLDVSLFPFLPVPIGIPNVTLSVENYQDVFKSLVATKVVTKYAVEDHVVKQDLQSTITTKNIAFDAHTGSPLITSVENEFNDPIYSFNMPGYWAYPSMGLASENMTLTLDITTGPNGNIIGASGVNIKGGDYVYLHLPESPSTGKLYLVSNGAGGPYLEADDGYIPRDINLHGSVVQSRNKNQLGTMVASYTSKKLPITNGELNFSNKGILAAQVSEFSDDWINTCGCIPALNSDPYMYRTGRKYQFRPKNTFAYLAPRVYDNNSEDPLLYTQRTNGTYSHFSSFWTYNSGLQKYEPQYNNWQEVEEVVMVNKNGLVKESKNAIDQYSAAKYIFKDMYQEVIANNSRYKELGYENFEEVGVDNCGDAQFRFFLENEQDGEVGNTNHTGRKGIMITAKSKASTGKIDISCD
jgi:hypothetical protein